MLSVACLLYGNNNFEKSICLAVENGYDTDCNGATVGSIMGMKNGIDSISKKWSEVTNGKLDTNIFGIGIVDIEDMVEKTLINIKK